MSAQDRRTAAILLLAVGFVYGFIAAFAVGFAVAVF